MDENIPPVTPTTPANTSNETLMGVLAYLGILIIVPFMMAKNDPFVKFHIKQGLVLVILEIASWALASVLWQFWEIFQLVNLGVLVLAIIGIVNVVNRKQDELPLVGSFAHNFKF